MPQCWWDKWRIMWHRWMECWFFSFVVMSSSLKQVNVWLRHSLHCSRNTERSQSGFSPARLNSLKSCQRWQERRRRNWLIVECVWIIYSIGSEGENAPSALFAASEQWMTLEIGAQNCRWEKKKRSNTDLKKRDVSVTDTQRVISALTPTWHVLLPIFRAPLDRCSLPRGSRRPASRSPGEIWESLWDKQRKRELKSLIVRAHFPHLRVCRNGFSARLCKAASLCQRD